MKKVTQSFLFPLAVISGSVTTILIIIGLVSNNWEQHTYNEECVLSKNASDCVITRADDYYKVEVGDSSNGSLAQIETYYLHNQYAGVWKLCNQLSGSSPLLIYGRSEQKCFDYLMQYPVIKSTLSKETIQHIQMRYSAMSSLILDLLMLTVAVIIAIVGFLMNQVICLTTTAVMYILTAFYTMMALIVMHVKNSKEVGSCSGLLKLPSNMCECYEIYADWSFYITWLAVAMATISCILWVRITGAYRQSSQKIAL